LVIDVVVLEVVVGNEFAKVDGLSVGALTQSLAELRFSRAHWANHEGNLGEHGSAGLVPNVKFVTGGVDFADLAKLGVHVDNGLRLVLVGL